MARFVSSTIVHFLSHHYYNRNINGFFLCKCKCVKCIEHVSCNGNMFLDWIFVGMELFAMGRPRPPTRAPNECRKCHGKL